MKVQRIDVAIDKAALYDWAIYDLDDELAEKAMETYCEIGKQLIEEAYPGAEIDVWLSLQQGPDRITVEPDDCEDEVKADVLDCLGRIYENWPEEV